MDIERDTTPEWGYCQVAGCTNDAIPCWVEGGPPDDPDDRLCAEHCKDEGYCWGCGHLWAGIERFDFNPLGLCENCEVEFREPEVAEEDIAFWWDS